jgi:hypothetical protein
MFAGRHFSSGDAALDPYVQLLDARVSALFPEFSDGSAEARLRLRLDQASSRGHRPQPAQEFRPGFGGVAVTPETANI